MTMKDFLMIGWELDYSRNRVLLNKSNLNYDFIEIPKISYFKRQILLLKISISLLNSKNKVIFMPAFNQSNSTFILLFSKLLKKKLIIDLLISDYDTLVNDRKLVRPLSLKAIKAYINDYLNVKLADVIICDTNLHKEYFENKFNGRSSKFKVIPVGAESIFVPTNSMFENNQSKKFRVLFYGGFSPLHGIHHIIDAAKLLKDETDIEFLLIGTGQTRDEIEKNVKDERLQNVTFINKVEYLMLPKEIANSSVGLGIFGESDKVDRVIPNKVFQIAACAKPIITLDTPSIRELFENNKDILLVDANSNISVPNQIASLILRIRENPFLMNQLSEEAYKTIDKKCNNEIISNYFKKIVNELGNDPRGVEALNAD